MKLEGKLFKGNLMTDCKEVVYSNNTVRFSKELEEALILLCRELDVPVPLWLTKNTKEFAAFRQTVFFAEAYTEKVRFDRFQIRYLEE